jgi:hypothetical protein
MAVQSQSLRPLSRGDVVRGHRCADRQQIIRRLRGGTLMRYYSSARPEAIRPGGTRLPTARGLPITVGRLAERLAACNPGAVAAAVDLPAVAATADDYLLTALLAQEQTTGRWLRLPLVADEA